MEFIWHSQNYHICIKAGKTEKWKTVVCCLTLTLGEVPQWCFLIDPVLIDGINVVLRRLQGAQFSGQVAVLTAVRAPGTWTQHTHANQHL